MATERIYNNINYDFDYYELEEKPFMLVLKKEGTIIFKKEYILENDVFKNFIDKIESIWDDINYRGVEDTRYSLILFRENLSYLVFDNYGESNCGFLCFYSISDCSYCEDTYIEKISSNKYFLQSRDTQETYKYDSLISLIRNHIKF